MLTGLTSPAQKRLEFIDKAYEATIKTVMLYPTLGNITDNLNPAVTSIDQNNLVLEFDELSANRANFNAKLIHCNYDWTQSTLHDMDFMHDYNEYNINDYSFSSNTHVPYVHYKFAIPPVKLPGNYLLIVYRDGNKNDLVISRRLMVYAEQINVTYDNQFAGTGTGRSTQPINFTLNYAGVDIQNPLQSLHVVILQNHRWDNFKSDLAPNFIRDQSSELEYRFFDEENTFKGDNEFRFVDFRSLNYPGQNTGSLDKSRKPFHLFVAQDRPRTDQAYSQYNDYDGGYIIDNKDYGEAATSGNYIEVTFTLNPYQKYNYPIYVLGAFNQWNHTEENKLTFNTTLGIFEQTLLLKQGLYNYQYVIDSPDKLNSIEGNHFETQNSYEIFIYNRSFQPNADLLLGYSVRTLNPR